ncbi:hypothetical protein EDB86DRAFT_894868 [Lactarius hatsudake]|nr:hypothetical protein EDB86DRAFT_894868 [Lactarius hatsudake]
MSTSSEPNINAKPRKKDVPPLALEDTLRDLAILRASGVDLPAALASTTASTVPVSTTATASDTSVARSYEFARAARDAITISNRGDVEAQVERVNDVREKLENVAAGLQDG